MTTSATRKPPTTYQKKPPYAQVTVGLFPSENFENTNTDETSQFDSSEENEEDINEENENVFEVDAATNYVYDIRVLPNPDANDITFKINLNDKPELLDGKILKFNFDFLQKVSC